MNLGYCCINLQLAEQGYKTNRTLRKDSLQKKGLDYVFQKANDNLDGLLQVLNWNIENDVRLYRFSSTLFPWMSEYEFENLPNWDKLLAKLRTASNLIQQSQMRVTFHPGPYTVLASANKNALKNAIRELEQTAKIFDLMNLEQSHKYPINIHVNRTKPSHAEVAATFIENFNQLSTSVKSRLTLENDHHASQWSVKMLYDLIYQETKIPIVFDQHHFKYGPQDQTMQEALHLAARTWPDGIRQLTHTSSAKTIEDESSVDVAHADYIYEEIQTFGLDFDCEIEAKAKEKALLKYRKDFLTQ